MKFNHVPAYGFGKAKKLELKYKNEIKKIQLVDVV